MGRSGARIFHLAFVLFLTLQTPASAAKRSYLIIFYGQASPSALLATVTSDFKILYDFMSTIHGMVVQIDDGFVTELRKLPGVLALIPDRLYKPHTTHSWEFLGLERDGKPSDEWKYAAKFGEGVIIGNIDTGVWPTSESFKDDGLVAPSGWCGTCDAGNDPTFRCNNKLIGARYFNKGILAGLASSGIQEGGQLPNQTELYSPRDYVGHGSHTLSTAGGGFVPGASVFDHGKGTAKGGSPLARVAAYKACYTPGCSSLDILAAIIAGVKDGVQVLSLSVGADASDYFTDPIAIGAFFAVQNGVTVVCSAGNSGPQPSSVTNVAPWIFTVGASTMDRDFPAYVTFGNYTIKGQSLANSTLPAGQQYRMISGGVANVENQPTSSSTLCLPGSLDPAKVSGKIVVCTRGVNARVEKGLVVKQAGGVGMVLCNDASTGDDVIADPHLIAAAHCSYSLCSGLFKYIQITDCPVGYIRTTDAELGVEPAPEMAAFSSRGPNPITPQILKPDITAPGVSVIAAYSGAVSPTDLAFDDRRVPYNIESGTSMSCPHVSGIAGLVKTKYPDWSPAMIKSAIMTTAITGANNYNQIRDETGAAATPFSYGSGHVNPVQALDPGLVYDTTLADYASNFLCSVRPTQNVLPVSLPLLPLPLFSGNNPFTCSQGAYGRPEDLNYPSITVACLSGTTAVKRRVKNVGAASCKYTANVTQPSAGVKVSVEPNVLRFDCINEEKEFTVKLDVYDGAAAANYVFGGIEWSDGKHRVRSPVVATTRCG